jgi:hypothetical protein
MLSGWMTNFYDTLRWPGWEGEVAVAPLGLGTHTFPPPWSREGQDLSTVSRQVVPLPELCDFHMDVSRQFRATDQAT